MVTTVEAVGNVYVSLTLDYTDGKLSKLDIKLIQSEELLDFSKKLGDYKAVIKSFDDNVLFETYFDITTEVVPEPLKEWFDEKGNQIVIPDKPVDMKLKDASVVVFVPYFKNGKVIEIYDKSNKLKLTIDISDFATCNINNICDLKESHDLCPEDCLFLEEKIKLSWWERVLSFLKNLFK